MRAAYIDRFGGADQIIVADRPEPKVGPDTVLIDIHASSVNPVDWKIREGRLQGAFDCHFPLILGWDVAGVVAAVGPAITEFQPGDEVIAYVRQDVIQHGGYSERIGAPVRCVGPKPAALDFGEAAALPLAGSTALQALDAVAASAGDTVFVANAAGGVGAFAVQIAVARGARVVGTAGPDNHEFLRSLGATPVDYHRDLGAQVAEAAPDGVDAAVDFAGGELFAFAATLVRPQRLASVTDAAAVSKAGGRYVFVRPSFDSLAELARLADAGSLRVEVARRFPLDQAAAAQELSASGHVRGKVIIDVR